MFVSRPITGQSRTVHFPWVSFLLGIVCPAVAFLLGYVSHVQWFIHVF